MQNFSKKNLIVLLSCSLLFIILFSSLALSVGLMGEKLTVRMDFIPYYQEDFSYYITPTTTFTQDYKVIIGGDLAEYVHVEKDYYERIGPNDMPRLSGYLKLPETLPPGEHVAKITVMETAAPGSAAISVLAGVRGVIYVRSYYPEPYPIFTFRANSGNVNETSNFVSKINYKVFLTLTFA